MKLFAEGVFAGLFLSIMIGPVFFKLIQTSITKGFYVALAMAVGIAISDLILISICIFCIKNLSSLNQFNDYLHMFGGITLIIFGINHLMLHPKMNDKGLVPTPVNYIKAFSNGIILNILNPSVILFWIGIVGVVNVKYDNNYNVFAIFFGGILFATLLSDVLKAYLAHQLKKFFNTPTISVFNKMVGGIMVGGGLMLVVECF
jgi:threonine/homoserine/homoserine lactone efflux protein